MNAHRTGHQSARRRQYARRRAAGWSPAYDCPHCDDGTIWTRATTLAAASGTEHRCDNPNCCCYRRVK